MPKLAPLFAITTLMGAVVSVYLWQQLHAERQLSADLQERVTQLELRPGTVTTRPGPTNTVAATPATDSTSHAAAPGETPARNDVAARPARPVSINMRELLKDPEFREAQRMQLRSSMLQTYPDLAKELGLTAEEVDAMLDVLSKRTLDSLANAMDTSNGPPDEATMQEMRRQAQESQRTQESELRALLGGDKYQKWQEYQQGMPARQQVNQLRTALASGGQPLSDTQAKSLVAVVSDEQKRRSQEMRNVPPPSATDQRGQADWAEENLRRTEESNRRILSAAAAYLDSRQLAAYERTLNQQLAMNRAFQRAQRAQIEAGGGQAAGGTTVTAPVVISTF